MGTLTMILAIVLVFLAGFILGALVYRNNSRQLNNLTDTVIDLAEQIKDLKR